MSEVPPKARGLHIGQLIKEKIEEKGMSKAEFGRRISTSRQNVNAMLQKPSLECDKLFVISKVLEHNFFEPFIKQLPFLPEISLPVPTRQVQVTIGVNNKEELHALIQACEDVNLIPNL